MDQTITITSKGQTTIPVSIRKKLGVDKGGKLTIHFNEESNQLTVTKPLTIDELSAWATSLIKPGTPPLLDVSGFYQTRKPRI